MTTTIYEQVAAVITQRRTIKPAAMNGKKIDDETVRELLQLADWAPTHGLTEPWYFVVYSGEKVQEFCAKHAELYKEFTPEANFNQGSYDNLKKQGDLASHVMAICMKRGSNPKIPEIEEIAAVACAVENLWLGAAAQDIAVYWGSGGMTFHPAMKDHLGLREEDKVMGFLYLGYTDEAPRPGRRVKPLEEKVKWM